MLGGRIGAVAVVLGAALAAAAPAGAAVVWFARGGQAEAKVEADGARVRLTIPGRSFEFAREDIRWIATALTPEEEWPDRESAARAGGAPTRFEAAWWALEHGLTPQAVAMLREAHALDPRHEPTRRMVAALDRLAAARPDPALAPAGRFEVARGPHVILLHQLDPAAAAERVDLLERVATTYFLTLAAWGVALPVPAHRLPSMHFARQDDYLAFLHAEDADAFRTTLGYYHPTRRLVVSHDPRDGEPRRTARAAIDQARRESERGRAGPRLDRLRRDAGRRELLLEQECRAMDLSTAAHEMVHQLADATGLCPRPDAFPVWLHEGLAAQFEVVRGGRWAGVGRADDFRLPTWRRLAAAPRLAPIVRDAGFGHGYHPDRYAEAWALVYFLRKEHPRQFLAFLDLLRAPDPDPEDRADRTLAAFRSAFGDDLAATEAAWRRTIDALQTPSEEAARTP